MCIQAMGNILATWNLVQAVLFHSVRGIVLGFGTYILFVNFHRFCSQLHEDSEKLLGIWKKYSRPACFIKFRLSCKSVRVPLGRFFFFDRSLLLTTFQVIMDN